MAIDSPSSKRPDRALVLVAHGTDSPSGQATVTSLRDAVAELVPEAQVVDAYVDVQQPRLQQVVDSLVQQRIPTVIVPALLSTGYHVEVDIERAVARSELVTATPPLGPHPILAEILADRLHEAGVPPEQAVVLAAAGSSRATGVAAVRQQAEMLAALRPGTATAAFISAAQPSVEDSLVAVRAEGGKAAVAAYLLGHGVFHDRLRSHDAVVSEPIGADPRLAELVRLRYVGATDG
ncbi:sirohydrochlorin chelatase [Flexivirga endophytica]|uniref:sirohydrochlorin chelatase n=1 Tax=Flexivirga endophytica TaxID=1849103 RepID=UPI0016698DEC|nr:sirohydrochlorin chelatase [Flexivirga endophytica]